MSSDSKKLGSKNFSFYKELSESSDKFNSTGADNKSFFTKMSDSFKSTRVGSKTSSFMEGATEKAQASYNYAKNLPYIILLCIVGGLFLFLALWSLPFVLISP